MPVSLYASATDVKTLRLSLAYSQQDLADAVGTSVQTIGRMEHRGYGPAVVIGRIRVFVNYELERQEALGYEM